MVRPASSDFWKAPLVLGTSRSLSRACLYKGILSNVDDHGSENVAKKMNFRSFKLNRVYLDPLNISNVGDFSWR